MKSKLRREVLVPLGAIAGSALITALPMLARDERAEVLREKMKGIAEKEADAVAALGPLELEMLEVALTDEKRVLYLARDTPLLYGTSSLSTHLDKRPCLSTSQPITGVRREISWGSVS